ncbi:helix-turn-helix transcriptional regulator [Archangium minus]|uniref:Helix-turn-helix transcriptional regulator n=1 Tax=Archangium minus TaxID=83450 RepID=A0ABY9WZ00_9BACT|nr:helix-turn-helix transcriptional regulator [Archangium minus]
MRANGLARELIERIADKWTLLIVAALGEEPKLRFSGLRERIERVSHKMLAQTLRQLERDGLVMRTVHPVVPPHVEYQLTPLGRSLLVTVTEFCAWTRRHMAEVEQARSAYDARASVEDAPERAESSPLAPENLRG